ncbi:MAG: hypothetical protein KGO03_05755, partial [Gemmatimonadota bacterium]|nr:hypothetical protein [Gemmatimonadota bacterium]
PMRGLYVTRAAASGPAMWSLLALARRTGLNTLVFDVKDARGRVLYPSTVGLAHLVGADADGAMPVARVHALMDSLRAHRIFAIARIVVGVDPLLAAQRPEWAVRQRDGQPWHDSTGAPWIDPSHRAVWAYAADLASEAVARGFDAVEFDDARFPDAPGMAREARFALPAGRDRAQVVRDGLAFLDYRTAPLGAPVAFAVPGEAAADSSGGPGGLRWDALAARADLVMPREFPSAFPAGAFGLADPASQPYELVSRALAEAKRRDAAVRGAGALVPWYQDFSMGAAAYDSARVRDQIRAGYAAGIRGWLLWNPASEYTEAALREPAPRRDSTGARPGARAKSGAKSAAKGRGRAAGRR